MRKLTDYEKANNIYAVRYTTMCNGSAKWAARSGRYSLAIYEKNTKTNKYHFFSRCHVFYGSKVQCDIAREIFQSLMDKGYADYAKVVAK
jgi:hypothetical protein